ncbi:transporter substrate-binding domain-containing protein, partial [Escherichia coli]|nr:transporter substrate-binding domain-containing protein [Escherichia coli]
DVAHTFADLKAKKVGVVKGTLHQRYLRDKQKAVQAVPYDDVASALAALKAGQITGVMGDFATLDAWQQENPDYAIMDER